MKKLFLTFIFMLVAQLAVANSSMPPLHYDSSVSSGDCYGPKNKRFPMILKVTKIDLVKKKYNLVMYFEKSKGKYFEKTLGEHGWDEKSIFWEKVNCPVVK